ncbi:MAG: hypothetical protein ACT4N2_15185 [Hyphomicrobium sp.]
MAISVDFSDTALAQNVRAKAGSFLFAVNSVLGRGGVSGIVRLLDIDGTVTAFCLLATQPRLQASTA